MSDQQWAPPAPPTPEQPQVHASNGYPPPVGRPHAPAAQQVLPPPPAFPGGTAVVSYAATTFCRGCGSPLNAQAAICMHCGVPTGSASPPLHPANPKAKSTAVVLAVFF